MLEAFTTDLNSSGAVTWHVEALASCAVQYLVGTECYYSFHLTHALCLAKEKEGKERARGSGVGRDCGRCRLYVFIRVMSYAWRRKRGEDRNYGSTVIGSGMGDNRAQAKSKRKG
jgi:hypothetical protein